jgi:3-keto-5-aminohexanoate cleavage enzyme
MGSVNFGEGVYVNTLPDIRFWAAEMRRRGVVPELEIFEAGMLASVARLVDEGVLAPPLNFNFSLGFRGALPADPRHLAHLAAMLPPGSHWSVIHEGMEDFRLLAAALGLGATGVRAGYEDGRHLAPGVAARSNIELVKRLAELVRLLGLEIATPAEARVLLGVRAG